MRRIIFVSTLIFAPTAMAFENAKVLPKGVRNVNIRQVETTIDSKTTSAGSAEPLAQPLMQELTFEKIAKGEEAMQAKSLRAFLLTNGFAESEAVGEFKADLKGRVSVTAPIVSYGLTERLTLAVAAPYYRAATSIDIGFQPNARAEAFLAALAADENNQTAAAREAGDKLNNAVFHLNKKLADNGYRSLEDWEGNGMGDMTVAAKYLAYNAHDLAAAVTSGIVLPTGRTDDPNILNDTAFGDGQWDSFAQLAIDEPFANGVSFNQFGKYTVQLPGTKTVRQVTDEEQIEVGEAETRFKLGDKIDAGTSVQYQPAFGLVTGLGYTFFKKYGDTYRELPAVTKAELEDRTDMEAHNGEVMLGYSTIPAYQRGSFAAPLELKLTYTNQVVSRNMPVTDMLQLDLNLFF
jgi:hypothetical protein